MTRRPFEKSDWPLIVALAIILTPLGMLLIWAGVTGLLIAIPKLLAGL